MLWKDKVVQPLAVRAKKGNLAGTSKKLMLQAGRVQAKDAAHLVLQEACESKVLDKGGPTFHFGNGSPIHLLKLTSKAYDNLFQLEAASCQISQQGVDVALTLESQVHIIYIIYNTIYYI